MGGTVSSLGETQVETSLSCAIRVAKLRVYNRGNWLIIVCGVKSFNAKLFITLK